MESTMDRDSASVANSTKDAHFFDLDNDIQNYLELLNDVDIVSDNNRQYSDTVAGIPRKNDLVFTEPLLQSDSKELSVLYPEYGVTSFAPSPNIFPVKEREDMGDISPPHSVCYQHVAEFCGSSISPQYECASESSVILEPNVDPHKYTQPSAAARSNLPSVLGELKGLKRPWSAAFENEDFDEPAPHTSAVKTGNTRNKRHYHNDLVRPSGLSLTNTEGIQPELGCVTQAVASLSSPVIPNLGREDEVKVLY